MCCKNRTEPDGWTGPTVDRFTFRINGYPVQPSVWTVKPYLTMTRSLFRLAFRSDFYNIACPSYPMVLMYNLEVLNNFPSRPARLVLRHFGMGRDGTKFLFWTGRDTRWGVPILSRPEYINMCFYIIFLKKMHVYMTFYYEKHDNNIIWPYYVV